MSTREAVIDEIKSAPEALVRETYDFILFLKQKKSLETVNLAPKTVTAKPDFMARQRALFGGRELPDSDAILDELRKDRF